MVLRSTPSFTISQRGLSSRSLLTDFYSLSNRKSISCTVVNRPNPTRIEVWAISSDTPNARNTYDGSSDSEVQADPELTAQVFSDISKLSPST